MSKQYNRVEKKRRAEKKIKRKKAEINKAKAAAKK